MFYFRERGDRETMNYEQVDEDQMAMVSQFYPGVLYSQIMISEQAGDETKTRRRRRKKGKGETSEEGGARKRKLSAEQVKMLEKNFGSEHKLESERKDKIASELGLDPRQVAVWFQNRRARWKIKKLEEEYSRLKSSHDKVVVEKCHLESEVLKLKEQLSEAETAMQQLSERNSDMVSSNSPHSALSMDAMDQLFLGEFGAEGLDDMFYVPENNYINGMEWANLYYM